MMFKTSFTTQIKFLKNSARWIFLSALVAVLAGTASAFFLWSLEEVTATREAHQWLIAFLPLGGFAVGLLYHYFGHDAVRGHNLILDEIHEPQNLIPKRMGPLVFLGTIVTHLFGGSAGREGTAVQMGAVLADRLSTPFRLSVRDRRLLLMAGMSAGFGSVFGTPLAGALFGLEVLTIGRMKHEGLLPCLVASVLADAVTKAWGIHHTVYSIGALPEVSLSNLALVSVTGIVFGLSGFIFSAVTHRISKILAREVQWAPLRPAVGGVIVAIAVGLAGTTKFIGLGIPTMTAAFAGPVGRFDFLFKFAFTVITLGAGFKGGEVTPLFFIGATLGNSLAGFFGTPSALLTGVGFVAVFAGAANTPISSMVMAIELFGPKIGIFAALGCTMSYLFSGRVGIYHGQRGGHQKAT